MPKGPADVQLDAKDAPACLLPNGRVLCVLNPVVEAVATRPRDSTLTESRKDAERPACRCPCVVGRLLPVGPLLASSIDRWTQGATSIVMRIVSAARMCSRARRSARSVSWSSIASMIALCSATASRARLG